MTSRVDAIISYVILVLFSVISVGPIIGIIVQAFTGPQLGRDWTIDNMVRIWHAGLFPGAMLNSLIVAVGVTIVGVTLSVLAGYAFGCLRFRGSTVLFYLILLGLIVPLEPVLISLYFNFLGLRLTDTYPGLIIAQAMFYFPFGVFWMRAFFRSIPRSLLEAARIDGASDIRVLFAVLLPAAGPAIMTLSVLMFVWSWNEFFLPLVIWGGKAVPTATVVTGLFTGQRLADIPGAAAAAVILSVPVLAVYVVFQRHFIRGVLAGSVKG
jgi:raffinose/stachyose/melibiose transport system permease protein